MIPVPVDYKTGTSADIYKRYGITTPAQNNHVDVHDGGYRHMAVKV